MNSSASDPMWQASVVAAIGDRHDLAVYDENLPLAPQFEGVEAVLDEGGSIGTREMYDAAKDTRFWQVIGTGLDHVDVAYMKSKGFMVSNCPGQFSSVALSECAMMYILMLSRRFHEAHQNFQNGVFYRPPGIELIDAKLGLVGFGASAQELARRARPFGMKIMAIDIRKIEDEILDEIQPEFMGTPDDLDRVVAESDFLSLHLHLNAETRHTIDARRIGMMKKTACIINVARGALVDEEAMHEALLAGRLGGAGLDVYSAEPPDPTLDVYQLPNVVVTPHISGGTDGTARKRAAVAAENVDRIGQGLEPLYRVDL
jgi:phosphoglycerate dehydrogenase-like enzyme